MGVYTTPCVPQIESIPKEWGAGRFFEVDCRFAQEDFVPGGSERLRVRKDEDMRRFDALLLDTRGRNVYLITEKQGRRKYTAGMVEDIEHTHIGW